MRNGFLGSIAALAAGAGLAWGQGAAPPPAGAPGGPAVPHGGAPGISHAMDPGLAPAVGYGAGAPIVAPNIPGPGGGLATDPVAFPSHPTYPPVGPPLGHPGMGHPGMGDPALGAPGCPPGGFGGGGSPGPACWFTGEYLLWFVESHPLSTPLLTTSAPADLGVLGQPTTGVLVGGDVGFDTTNGFRLTGGLWCDRNHRLGLEFVGLFLENDVADFDAISSPVGIPLLARPFTDVTTGQASSMVIAFPQFATGGARIKVDNQIWGAEGHLLVNLFRSPPSGFRGFTLNWLGGFRYFEVDESVKISSTSSLLPGTTAPFGGVFVLAPADIGVVDLFETRNSFYAGQLGLQTEFRRGKWLLTMAGKVALGDLHQELEISGISTLQQEPPDPFTGEPGTISGVQGGLLANAGNIGRTTRDEFGVLPEFTCNLACQITPNLSAFVGYNVIWLGDVVRAGAQINPRINPGLVPTSFAYGQSGFVGANPPTMVEEDVWVQGINFGFTVRY